MNNKLQWLQERQKKIGMNAKELRLLLSEWPDETEVMLLAEPGKFKLVPLEEKHIEELPSPSNNRWIVINGGFKS